MSLDINIFDLKFILLARIFLTVSFVISSTLFSYAQSTFTGSWTAYFSYNSIKDIDKGNGVIFAASQNAIFSYDPNTNIIEKITTIDGLSGDYITTIKYSNNYNLLLIGYETGLLEVYDLSNKTVLKVLDILNKTTIPAENRRINDFYERDNLIYIATNYGISIYDIQALEFGDTYYIGSSGAQVQVNQITLTDNYIYAATNVGLKKANLNNPNLVDFQFWETLFLGSFSAVIFIDNKLFTVKSENLVYQLNGLNLDPVINLSQPIVGLEANSNTFSVITTASVSHYQSDSTLIDFYSSSFDFNTNFRIAKLFDDTIYIGTDDFGILKGSLNSSDIYESIYPDGPLRNNPFSLEHGYGSLWVTYGDYDEDFNPNPNRTYGFSFMENDIWNNITYDSIQQTVGKPVFNLNAISINPFNSNQVFISSFQHGMLNFQKNNSIEILDETNSALQSLEIPGSNYKSIRLSGSTFDNQGALWSLTSKVNDPLKKYNVDTNQWETFSFSTIIEDPINDELGFGALLIGPDETKWVGSYSNGVIGFKESGNLIRQIKGEDVANLPINHIKTLALDKNNVLWIGTYKGLRVFYNTANFFTEEVLTTLPIIILEDGLAKELLELQFITKIIVDGSNNKWISTADSGVFYLSSDGQNTIYHFTEDNSPLPSNTVTTMVQNENNGKIYFGTNRGLVAFNAGGSSPSNSLDEVYAYPNPVRPKFNLVNDKVKIKNLSNNVNIKITDVAGNLVAEAQSNTNLRFKGYNLEIDGGTAYWNGKNLANRTVASGVYVVLILDLDNMETKVLKIMLIRQ